MILPSTIIPVTIMRATTIRTSTLMTTSMTMPMITAIAMRNRKPPAAATPTAWRTSRCRATAAPRLPPAPASCWPACALGRWTAPPRKH
ncbi:hypothetical protein G6F24_018891 [Rhizopus arrhizus]|nr:hypothetical protein G6F24_018891 [Rhizopus arrhizus]